MMTPKEPIPNPAAAELRCLALYCGLLAGLRFGVGLAAFSAPSCRPCRPDAEADLAGAVVLDPVLIHDPHHPLVGQGGPAVPGEVPFRLNQHREGLAAALTSAWFMGIWAVVPPVVCHCRAQARAEPLPLR
jgi:hypothetical protein